MPTRIATAYSLSLERRQATMLTCYYDYVMEKGNVLTNVPSAITLENPKNPHKF